MKSGLALLFTVLIGASPAFAGSVYDVPALPATPDVKTEFAAPAWAPAAVLSGGFHFPWENRAAPATRFRAAHDDKTFTFAFDVDDPDVVVLDKSIGERETIDAEDRVELFFAPGSIDKPLEGKLPAYYAVEVDAAGRVHDYSMVYYRKIDSSWSMAGLEVSGRRTPTGYAVTGRISLDTLRSLKLIGKDGSMHVGAYRAEFSGKQGALSMQWISWVDPEVPEPDFHLDASFGTFRLLDMK